MVHLRPCLHLKMALVWPGTDGKTLACSRATRQFDFNFITRGNSCQEKSTAPSSTLTTPGTQATFAPAANMPARWRWAPGGAATSAANTFAGSRTIEQRCGGRIRVARTVSAGIAASRLPACGPRQYGARGNCQHVCVGCVAGDGARKERRHRKEGPQNRLHRAYLRSTADHGRFARLLPQAGPERVAQQNRRLGADARQDDQQGI